MHGSTSKRESLYKQPVLQADANIFTLERREPMRSFRPCTSAWRKLVPTTQIAENDVRDLCSDLMCSVYETLPPRAFMVSQCTGQYLPRVTFDKKGWVRYETACKEDNWKIDQTRSWRWLQHCVPKYDTSSCFSPFSRDALVSQKAYQTLN